MKKKQKKQVADFINFLKNRIGKNKIYRLNKRLDFSVRNNNKKDFQHFPLWKIRQLILKSFKNPEKVVISFLFINEMKETNTFPWIEVQWDWYEEIEERYLYYTERDVRIRRTAKRKF